MLEITPPQPPKLSVDYKEGADSERGIMKENAVNQSIFGNAQNYLNYTQGLGNFYLDKMESDIVRTIKADQEKQKFIDYMKNRDLQMNAQLKAFERSNEATASQFEFNTLGAERAKDNLDLQLNERLKGLDFEMENATLNYSGDILQSGSQLTQLSDDFDSAQVNADVDDLFTEFTRGTTDSAIAYQMLQDQQAYDNTASEIAYRAEEAERSFTDQLAQTRNQKLNAKLETIVQRGQAAARGQVGISAQRGLNTITALGGINQAALNDSILRAGVAKDAAIARGEELDDEAYTRLSTQTNRAIIQKNEAARQETINKKRTAAQLNQRQVGIQNQADSIAEALGISGERFEMTRRQVGESMLNALSSYEDGLNQIFLDKFEADVRTYAKRMFEPKFADAPDAPFVIPKIHTIPPAQPITVPKAGVPQQEQKGPSALSKILTIAGVAATAAATGGLSLGAMGVTLGSTALGGIGAGLSGLGQGGFLD